MDARDENLGPLEFNSWYFAIFFIFFIIIGNKPLILKVFINFFIVGSGILVNMILGVIALNYSLLHD